ncbi:MAG TPA: HD domain-containing phosphohydrolase [Thermoanaerobaculia bacterium]|nr:HD domain-containing phosphohydrolase [Thermoanaerobaculia bacterium]
MNEDRRSTPEPGTGTGTEAAGAAAHGSGRRPPAPAAGGDALDARIVDTLQELSVCVDRLRQQRRELERERDVAVELQEAAERRVREAVEHLAGERRAARRLSTALEHLREHTLELHRALFAGDLTDLLLRAALAITGAARGVYFEVLESSGPGAGGEAVAPTGDPGPGFRLASSIDVPLGDGDSPPPVLRAVAQRCVAEGRSVLHEAAVADDADGARLGSHLLAAPVSLGGRLDGVVIVADKEGGFDEEDAKHLVSIGDQASVAWENRRLQRKLHSVHLEMVGMLADLAETKDPHTHGHCQQVAEVAYRLGERLGLEDEHLRVVSYAALLHDVGKVGVSDVILQKSDPLLAEEMELVRAHVRIGHGLLRRIPPLARVAEAVLHHHECWDGTGYPQGLAGEAIPVESRVVAVADSFCAMLEDRPYQKSRSRQEAMAELRRCAGTKFDPDVVTAMLALLTDDPALPAGGLTHQALLPDFGRREAPAGAAPLRS